MIENSDFLLEEHQESPTQDLQGPAGDLYLCFNTSGYNFALSAFGVREVLSSSPDRITPLPNTPNLLLGIINLRGRPVWVADLGQFFGSPEPLSIEGSEISVIVIEDQEAMAGFAVEQIDGTDWLEPAEIHPATNIQNTMAPFLKGEWLTDVALDKRLYLLNPTAILRSRRWVA